MKDSIINVVLASFSIVLTAIIQKVIFRFLGDTELPLYNIFFYWCSFIIIFIIIFGIINISLSTRKRT